MRDSTLQLSSSSDVGSSSGRKDVSDGDVLDEGRVDVGSVEGSLENSGEEILRATVFETSLLGLSSKAERKSKGKKREEEEGGRRSA